jgi:hypothetical protein
MKKLVVILAALALVLAGTTVVLAQAQGPPSPNPLPSQSNIVKAKGHFEIIKSKGSFSFGPIQSNGQGSGYHNSRGTPPNGFTVGPNVGTTAVSNLSTSGAPPNPPHNPNNP